MFPKIVHIRIPCCSIVQFPKILKAFKIFASVFFFFKGKSQINGTPSVQTQYKFLIYVYIIHEVESVVVERYKILNKGYHQI